MPNLKRKRSRDSAAVHVTRTPGRMPRGVLNKKKKSVPVSQKSPRALHVLNHGWWQLAVGGWRRLAVGGWQLAVGGSWWLAVGGGWQLMGVGGWRLVVPWGGP